MITQVAGSHFHYPAVNRYHYLAGQLWDDVVVLYFSGGEFFLLSEATRTRMR